MKSNYVLLAFTFFLLQAPMVLVSATTEHDWVTDYDAKIREHARKLQCENVQKLTYEARSRKKDLPQIPEWFELGIACYKSNPEFSMYGGGHLYSGILDYYEELFWTLTSARLCGKANDELDRLRRRESKHMQDLPLLDYSFIVARCYESVDKNWSRRFYSDMLKSHAGTDAAVRAQFRINFLTQDRSWIFSDPKTLIAGVKKALQKKDVVLLERYASKSEFSVGFENAPPKPFEREREFFSKMFKRTTPAIGPLNRYDQPDRFVLKVSFPGEENPDYYFIFREVDGGWQWVHIGLGLNFGP